MYLANNFSSNLVSFLSICSFAGVMLLQESQDHLRPSPGNDCTRIVVGHPAHDLIAKVQPDFRRFLSIRPFIAGKTLSQRSSAGRSNEYPSPCPQIDKTGCRPLSCCPSHSAP